MKVSAGLVILTVLAEVASAAYIAITVPESLRDDRSSYRLEYSPGIGDPPPNTIVDSADVIAINDALPGMKYEFRLFYNDGRGGRVAWSSEITTAPDPPTNLVVTVDDERTATATWTPPSEGNYSKFKLKLQNFDENGMKVTDIVLSDTAYHTFRDLSPDTEYSLEVFSVTDHVDSFVYAKTKFTTRVV